MQDLVRQVKEEVEDEWLQWPGVTGVDVGYKIVGGKKTDQPAILVYVKKKGRYLLQHEIPKTVGEVPTDVIERTFVLHTFL